MRNRFFRPYIWLWLMGLGLVGGLGWAIGSGWLDTMILEQTLLTGAADAPTVDDAVVPAMQPTPQAAEIRADFQPEPTSLGLGAAFMFGLSLPVLLLLLLLWRLYKDPRYPALALLISSIAMEYVVKDLGPSVQTAGASVLLTFSVTLVLITHFPLLFSRPRMIPLLRRSARYRAAIQRLHPNATARWHRGFCTAVMLCLLPLALGLASVMVLPVPDEMVDGSIQAGLYAPMLLVLPLGILLGRVFNLRRPLVFLSVMFLGAALCLMALGLVTSMPYDHLRYPLWVGLLIAVLGQLIVDVYFDVKIAERASLRINSLHKTVLHRATELKDMMVRAQAANLAKTQFVSSVSHELRTPLTAISGYAQILLEELSGENPMHEEFLGIIRQSCDRLKSLINDLLDMAKVESGRVELHISSIELAPVLNEVTAQLLPLAETKKIQLLRPRIDVHDAVVHADPLRLRQVLINLLSNAIKFTDKGCVGIYVKAAEIDRYQGTQHSEPAIALEVFDTGIGISDAFIDQLFEPFSQEESAYSNTQQGTGLGLSITKELVERMGGTISVESAVGEGTKFTVLLALSASASAAPPPVVPAHPEPRVPEPPSERTPRPLETSAIEPA